MFKKNDQKKEKKKFFGKGQFPKNDKITSSNLDLQREEILKEGRKYKYPVQFEKHKLIITTILISVFIFVVFIFSIFWRLYKTQATDSFMFKVTQIIPFKVANVDGEKAYYRDYLAHYRSSMHYSQTKEDFNLNKQDQKGLKDHYKNQSLENAAKIAYARKLQKDLNIKLEKQEIDQEMNKKLFHHGQQISKESFYKTIKDYYGLTSSEYERFFVINPLIMKKAIVGVDESARTKVTELSKEAVSVNSFEELAGKDPEIEFYDSGLMKRGLVISDREEVALKLEVGQISNSFVSNNLDGIYILKLLSKDEEKIRYQTIRIPLTEFNTRFNKLKDDQKIKYYI